MLYVLAILVVVALAAALWRLLGPQRDTRQPQGRVLAPDDDPDFLRELDKRARRPDDDDAP